MRPSSRREFLKGGAAALAGAGVAGCVAAGKPRPAAESVRIWDLHCHLRNDPPVSPAEAVSELLKYADRMGIERLILLAYGPSFATPDEVRQTNDRYMAALEKAKSRALGFAFLNPNHVEASLREMDRCIRDGPMVGVKLHVARRCSAPELDPIVRRAVEMRAPIYQHTWIKTGGNPEGESTPADVAELAERHPRASLICGHSGGNWELGVRAVRARPSVSFAVEGYDPTAGAVEMAVRELGAERVVYGSDVTGRGYASQLAKVVGAAVPESAKPLILGANLRRLLGPILKAKGIPS